MSLFLLKERLKEISNISYYFVFILCGEMAVFSPPTSKFEPKIVCLLKKQRVYSTYKVPWGWMDIHANGK